MNNVIIPIEIMAGNNFFCMIYVILIVYIVDIFLQVILLVVFLIHFIIKGINCLDVKIFL